MGLADRRTGRKERDIDVAELRVAEGLDFDGVVAEGKHLAGGARGGHRSQGGHGKGSLLEYSEHFSAYGPRGTDYRNVPTLIHSLTRVSTS